MITLKSCPVCGNHRIIQPYQAGFTPRFSYEIMPGVKVDVAVLAYYSMCQDCRLIFQNPRLSDSELAPLDYLKSMAMFINGSGYLVVEVPTWKSQAGPLRLAHLYHFEPDVIKKICEQAGLQVVNYIITSHLHLMLICCKSVN